MGLAALLPDALRRPLRRLWRTALAPVRGGMRNEAADAAIALPLGYTAARFETPRIAVVCHLFHDDLAGEFRRHLDHLPAGANLFLSTDTEAKATTVAAAFTGWDKGGTTIRVLPNRGRDIAPKLVGFADAYAGHDLVLFLHSKKSLTSPLGNDWRRLLLTTLAGSPRIVSDILAIFEARPDVGIVMAQHFPPIRGLLHWDGNFTPARALARRMGIALARHRTLDFPSGSMFWARTAALRPLLDLGLTWDDFPAEADQVRGTVQHAVERLFLIAAEHAGYGWLKVATEDADHGGPRVVAVADAAGLDAFVRDHGLDLLPRGGTRA